MKRSATGVASYSKSRRGKPATYEAINAAINRSTSSALV